jgi:outer membrane protein W
MKRFILAGAVLLALAAFQPAAAQDDWNVKFFGALAYVSPLGEDDVDVGSITDSIQASNETGWEAGLEFRFAKILGIEFSYLNSTHDVEGEDTTYGEVDFTPYNFALNFHLFPNKYVDFYVAPVVSYVNWGDLELSDGTSEETESEYAYGAAVGLDISFHKNFAFIGGVRWLSLDLTTEDSGSSDDDSVAVDPLFARVGFAFRF